MDTSTPTGGITGFTERPLRPQSGGKKRLVIIVIVLLILAGLGFMAFRQFNAGNEEVTPTEAPVEEEPTEEPEPTEDEEITPTTSTSATPTRRPTTGAVSNANDLSIQVLNGSGTEGAAGGVREFLSGKGYKNLATGNADNFDYEDVTVRVKSTRKDLADDVVSDLKEKYTVNATVGTLEASSEYDVLVIVGK